MLVTFNELSCTLPWFIFFQFSFYSVAYLTMLLQYGDHVAFDGMTTDENEFKSIWKKMAVA
jgi:hypothetical protein